MRGHLKRLARHLLLRGQGVGQAVGARILPNAASSAAASSRGTPFARAAGSGVSISNTNARGAMAATARA
jgi:hypothetical protein